MVLKCIYQDCPKYANYNYSIKTEALYCYDHKKENMIDIKNKRCLEKDCITRPSFNYKVKNNGIYCEKHKKDNID